MNDTFSFFKNEMKTINNILCYDDENYTIIGGHNLSDNNYRILLFYYLNKDISNLKKGEICNMIIYAKDLKLDNGDRFPDVFINSSMNKTKITYINEHYMYSVSEIMVYKNDYSYVALNSYETYLHSRAICPSFRINYTDDNIKYLKDNYVK